MTGDTSVRINVELLDYLNSLHRDAGKPSSRTLAAICGVSHTTVNEALNGQRMPGWASLRAIVECLDGDMTQVRAMLGEDHGRNYTSPRPTTNQLLRDILDELRSLRALLEKD